MVNNALENNILKRVIADGAYDNKENFRYLYDNNIEAAIKVRKNTLYDRTIDCCPRKLVAAKQLKNLKNGRLTLVMDTGGLQKQYSLQ